MVETQNKLPSRELWEYNVFNVPTVMKADMTEDLRSVVINNG